jgi:hypothetical protein
MLSYYNNVRHEMYTKFDAKDENLIRVPLGVSTFPYDAFPAPKSGVETTCTDLKFFRGMSYLQLGFQTRFAWDRIGERMTKWLDKLTEFIDHDRGGHFACMECPDEMVRDMRDFFGEWYKA